MKKLFLSLVAAIVAATATYAQSSLVATLSHEGQTTTYYGAAALIKAHEAAAEGDVITLSSGTFSAVDITKAITLRGAGSVLDVDNHKEPTIINGQFYIGIQDGVIDKPLTIEGIYSNDYIYYRGSVENARFIKNRFSALASSDNGRLQDCTFFNCIFQDEFYVNTECSATLANCVISYVICNSSTTSNLECLNCVFGDISVLYSSTLKNCIFTNDGGHVNSSNTVYACVSDYDYAFDDITYNPTNKCVAHDELFKNDFDWDEYLDYRLFELTDAAKTKYLGTDGTQVGIYGGQMPFDPTPTNPQITKFEVSSNAESGKLTVKINVE